MQTPPSLFHVHRPDRFRPPHCPYKECVRHRERSRTAFYCKWGWYRRKCVPRRRVRRFKCRSCKRTFSQQTFSPTYRMQRPELLCDVAELLVSGAANRVIARFKRCAPSTVMRVGNRLGEHCFRFHSRALQRAGPPGEPLVLDHFETFVRSQVERLGIATVVGQRSWFVYGIEPARYLGRMTRRSKRRKALKIPPKRTAAGAYLRSTRRVLGRLQVEPSGLQIASDDHPAYRATLKGLPFIVNHRTFKNPDRSTNEGVEDGKLRDRNLFPVDALHKLIRHVQAHHRRETIAFGRRTSNVMLRAAIFMVWRNYVKLLTERRPCSTTPAMSRGLTDRQWSFEEILSQRVFD